MKFQNRRLNVNRPSSSTSSSYQDEVVLHGNGKQVKKRGVYVEKKNSNIVAGNLLTVGTSSRRPTSPGSSNDKQLHRIDSLLDILSETQAIQFPETSDKQTNLNTDLSFKGKVVKEIHTKGKTVREITQRNSISRHTSPNNSSLIVLQPTKVMADTSSMFSVTPYYHNKRTQQPKMKASSYDQVNKESKRNKALCSKDDLKNYSPKGFQKLHNDSKSAQIRQMYDFEKFSFDLYSKHEAVKSASLKRSDTKLDKKRQKELILKERERKKKPSVREIRKMKDEPRTLVNDYKNKDSIVDFLVDLYEDNVSMGTTDIRGGVGSVRDVNITLKNIHESPKTSYHDNLSRNKPESSLKRLNKRSEPIRCKNPVNKKDNNTDILVSDGPYNYYMSRQTHFQRKYPSANEIEECSVQYPNNPSNFNKKIPKNSKYDLLNTLREQLSMTVEVDPEPLSIYEALQGMLKKKKKKQMMEEADALRLRRMRYERRMFPKKSAIECPQTKKRKKRVTKEYSNHSSYHDSMVNLY